MAADPMLSLSTQPEKPNHFTYLKEFRVEQCQSFLQHKCNQHRPFICFNWHFMNQRRRRPVRKNDGTFNYSADNYCAKYDETTGICPDGDECPFLHRTAGDTERRYHLRYYKTCMCVHDTDTRGYCVKNGHHCAFAHGLHDQRPPVFDIKEIETSQQIDINGQCVGGGIGGGSNGCVSGSNIGMINGTGLGHMNGGCGDMLNSAPNALDKERNLMNEDPKWQDTNYVLANYKTEPCKRPPRLCRQGYACPQYHNSKDKRRSPRKFKYRSTPCPNVKHGEEWGEPANCEAGDNCQYCHTRTEQQFHPEIYKSTKCNDVQQAGYCPRSVFCAFAHVEPYIISEDMQLNMDGVCGNNGGVGNLALGDLLGNVMQMDNGVAGGGGGSGIGSAGCIGSGNVKKERYSLGGMFGQCDGVGGGGSISSALLQNGCSGESCESASTSSVGSNQSHSKAPGSQLQANKLQHLHHQHMQQQQQQQHLFQNCLNNNNAHHHSSNVGNLTGLLGSAGGNTGVSHSSGGGNGNIGNGLLNAVGGSVAFADFTSDMNKQLLAIENDAMLGALEKEQRKRMCLTFGGMHSNSGGASGLNDELGCSRLMHAQQQQILHQSSASQPMNIPSQSQLSDTLNGFLQGNSAPVNNLPDNFSPGLFGAHFGSHIGGSAPKMHNTFGGLSGNVGSGSSGTDGGAKSLFFQSHLNDTLTISPELGYHAHQLNGLDRMHRDDFVANIAPNATPNQLKMNWDTRILQAGKACEAWRSGEADESNHKVGVEAFDDDSAAAAASAVASHEADAQYSMLNFHPLIDGRPTSSSAPFVVTDAIVDTDSVTSNNAHQQTALAEQQRDSALQLVSENLGQLGTDVGNGLGGGVSRSALAARDLRCLSIQSLKRLQARLRSDLEEVEKQLYMETATKCMMCEEHNRSVTLVPCNHYVLCEQCAKTASECPFCQTTVLVQS